MKLQELTLSEQVLVRILKKLQSIDPNSIEQFKDEVGEEVWSFVEKQEGE